MNEVIGPQIDGGGEDADHEILEIPAHRSGHRKQLHAFKRGSEKVVHEEVDWYIGV